MPPIHTSSLKEHRVAKKVGVMQKPKGAVRAKSGCYTCRIRRKKCDEKRVGDYDEGPCETCSRLKLECLGFGAKRPDWLRENSRVSAIRDRIKAHLAAQGMIKGHAGSGSRSTIHDEYLRLSDPRDHDMEFRTGGSSASTDGSPNREQSVDSDYPYSTRVSLITPRYEGDYEDHRLLPSDAFVSRSHSPATAAYDFYPSSCPVQYPESYYQIATPATRSSFSRNNLYHANISVDEIQDMPFDMTRSVHHFYPSEVLPHEFIDTCVRDYISNVIRIQYLLGDRNVLPNMIWESVQMHADSHEAVNLLAKAYYGRKNDINFSVLQNTEFQITIGSLQQSLKQKGRLFTADDAMKQSLKKQGWLFTADDAMAALHVVSLFLFEGGQGPWNEFLFFASTYVASVLYDPTYRGGPPEALECASAKDQFVIKTTIWFDVLASITTRKPPLLLRYIRALFHPARSQIGDQPHYSMLSPMGCENRVVWALAETVALADWKATQEASGTLSTRELVLRAADIDEHLVCPALPQPAAPNADADARAAAAEIFRTSARLFLRSVESGPFPHVPEVQACARETYRAIVEVPAEVLARAPPQTRSAVVRSTVFGIYICGSLTDDAERRHALRMQLQLHAGQEGVGNCAAVCALLDTMWRERDESPRNGPVRWRERLENAQILLV